MEDVIAAYACGGILGGYACSKGRMVRDELARERLSDRPVRGLPFGASTGLSRELWGEVVLLQLKMAEMKDLEGGCR